MASEVVMSSRRLPVVVLFSVLALVFASPAAAQDKLSQNRLDPRFADTPMITDSFDFSLGGFPRAEIRWVF